MSKNRRVTLKIWALICILISNVCASTALIGHRGGDANAAPENTLSCISASFSDGVWGHEVDVRITADGDLVLMHDSTVDRTTNGTGAISSLTTAYVRSLDAGSWKGSGYAGEQVPLLSEALTLIKSNGTRAYLDMKAGSAAAVKSIASSVGFSEDKLTFLTFTAMQSWEFSTAFPNSEVYWSFFGEPYSSHSERDLQYVSGFGVKGVTIWIGHYSKQYVQAIHNTGLKVALVGSSITDVALLDEYIREGVDELWLDDVTLNLTAYNDDAGSLSIPLPFAITQMTRDSSSQLTLQWNTVKGASYRLQSSVDLVNWVTLTTLSASTQKTMSYTYANGSGDAGKFFRVVAEVN